MKLGKWVLLACLIFALVLLLGACSKSDDDDAAPAVDDDNQTPDDDTAFNMTSTAFVDLGDIPAKYTCENGEVPHGVSPPLAWVNPPEGTVAFAITCRDPDSPSGDTHHWGLINIPADVSSLTEAVSPTGPLPAGSWQTLAYTEKAEYAGPCPPKGDGQHHYNFELIALSKEIPDPGTSKTLEDMLPELEEATIASTTLTGMFGRE